MARRTNDAERRANALVRRIAERERVIHFADSLPEPAPDPPTFTARIEGAALMMAEIARDTQERFAAALQDELTAEVNRIMAEDSSVFTAPVSTGQLRRSLPALEGHDATMRLDTWFGEHDDAAPRRPRFSHEGALPRAEQAEADARRDNWIARAISAGYTPARHDSRNPATRERLAEHARMSMNDRNLHHTMRLFMRVAELPPEQTTGEREELARWMRGQQAHRLVDWLATMFGAMMLDGDRLREMLHEAQDRERAVQTASTTPRPAPVAPKLPAHARGIKLPREGADD